MTVILLLALYECGNCSVTLREKEGLRVFGNRVLFGFGRNETTGCWREFHKEGLYNLCSISDILRMITSNRMR
jgi:hypothetical protein